MMLPLLAPGPFHFLQTGLFQLRDHPVQFVCFGPVVQNQGLHKRDWDKPFVR